MQRQTCFHIDRRWSRRVGFGHLVHGVSPYDPYIKDNGSLDGGIGLRLCPSQCTGLCS